MKKKALFVLVFVLGLLLSACGQVEADVTPTPEPTVTPTPTLEPPLLTVDWYICTTIEAGEGVYQALQRAAGGDAPGQWSRTMGQQIEIFHEPVNGNPAWVEVYSWETLPERVMVYPGDRVCDTIKPRLQLELEALPENIHMYIPPTATP